MESNPMFDQLLLLAVVWPCFLLQVLWPHACAASPTPPTPTAPRRQRSREPTPFVGLLPKPLCDACKHAVDPRPKAPASPPPVLTFTRGRKRPINTAKQFCPAQDCSYYGWTSRGNILSAVSANLLHGFDHVILQNAQRGCPAVLVEAVATMETACRAASPTRRA